MSVCLFICHQSYLRNRWSDCYLIWYGDGLRHENASRVNYTDLDLIQGHTDLNPENKQCSIISELFKQCSSLLWRLTEILLKVCMIFVSAMTFTQGHTCISNLTNVELVSIAMTWMIFSLSFKLCITVDWCMTYSLYAELMLVWMTLTLRLGRGKQIQHWTTSSHVWC